MRGIDWKRRLRPDHASPADAKRRTRHRGADRFGECGREAWLAAGSRRKVAINRVIEAPLRQQGDVAQKTASEKRLEKAPSWVGQRYGRLGCGKHHRHTGVIERLTQLLKIGRA